MKKVLALLMSLCMVLALAPTCAEGENDAKDVWNVIEDLYIYAFPLVMIDATKIVTTNTQLAAGIRRQIPHIHAHIYAGYGRAGFAAAARYTRSIK